jgi:hypothetical protein
MIKIALIQEEDVTDISGQLLENDKIILHPAEFYKKLKWEDFRVFCHHYARYGIPTIELVEYLKLIIGDRLAIEIGSGAGDLGYHLGIKMTDSKQQEIPHVIKMYNDLHQPVIKYPADVERIDALEAVIKYKPQVVVASWITPYAPHPMSYGSNPFGVRESEILRLVDTFVIVGNVEDHGDKPILQFEHKAVFAPWIISRAADQTKNCIYIWNKTHE